MEKQRKYKVFSIIALLFAVVALSVGFAAFQKVLNISSSAKILLPSEEELDIKIYGLLDIKEIENIFLGKGVNLEKWSTDRSIPALNGIMFPENYATIDNDNLIIDINNLQLKYGDECGYMFLMKNNSPYGVYLNINENNDNIVFLDDGYQIKGTCKSNSIANQELVEAMCENMYLYVSSSIPNFSTNKLERNNIMLFGARIEYNKEMNIYFDEDVIIEFPQIKLSFDTISNN